jgi:glycine/D-amino acid oxidase-like deaminating enzyme
VCADGTGRWLTDAVYKRFAKDTFVDWADEAPGEGLTRTWTGVMGYTLDRMPLVGALPDMPGVFVAVGFNGHGMSSKFE